MKKLIRMGLFALVGFVSALQAVEANKVLQEKWNGTNGRYINNMDWTLTPDSSTNIDAFEIDVNTDDYYGVRLTAEVTIPSTGQYIFYVASDDQGDLKLSTTNSEANLITIASVDNFVASPQNWTSKPEQKSNIYSFTAGQKILLSARMKEGAGGDHLSVGWSIDDGTIVVIPASVCTAPDSGPSEEEEVIDPADQVVLYETWQGISSDNLTNFDFAQTPLTSFDYVTFEAPSNNLNQYGFARMTAIVKVPKTGAYTFYTAADDQSKLSISTDGDMANIVEIISTNTFATSQQWTKLAEQKSAVFNLVAGQEIAIHLVHRDGGNNDNLAAGWSIDNGPIKVIIGRYNVWLTNENLQINTLATSQVSPAWIEGRVGAVNNVVQVTIDGGTAFNADLMGDTRFYANNSSTTRGITLSTTTATVVSVTNNVNTVNQSVTWTPTDIVTANDITIRKGDSLLLTASGTGTTLEIDSDWQSESFTPEHTGIVGDNFVQTFNTTGIFIVSGQIDGALTESVTVTVIDASFDEAIACQINYEREKLVSLSGADVEALTFTSSFDDNLSVKLNRWTSAGLIIDIMPLDICIDHAAIRINGENGPILDIREIEEFTFQTQATEYIGVVDEFEDGSLVVESNLEIWPKLTGLTIDMKIHTSGLTFEDGTTLKTVTSESFSLDTPAELPYQMIMNPNLGTGTCHSFKVYQNNVLIGEN